MKRTFSIAILAGACMMFASCQNKSGGTSETDSPKEEIEEVAEGAADVHEAVDLGLSVKWASCNIGAATPDQFGDYYAWGETKTKTSYSWANYFDCVEGEGAPVFKKYKDGVLTTLESEDDVAVQLWGNGWRMPTADEMRELVEKCKWEETTMQASKGFMVTGPNGNTIFLPFTGWRVGDMLLNDGGLSDYPTNETQPGVDDMNITLFIHNDSEPIVGDDSSLDVGVKDRSAGVPVRAVKP